MKDMAFQKNSTPCNDVIVIHSQVIRDKIRTFKCYYLCLSLAVDDVWVREECHWKVNTSDNEIHNHSCKAHIVSHTSQR